MATTAKQVFALAMHLMDEANIFTGQADGAENREYRNRTLPILNVLRVELTPFSDQCSQEEGKRPVCQGIEKLEDPIDLDDGLCQGVLPYGLAAHLLLDENPDMASFFQQRYEQLLAAAKQGVPAGSGEIELLYGGIELGQFAHW